MIRKLQINFPIGYSVVVLGISFSKIVSVWMERLGSIEKLSVSFAPRDAFWEDLLSAKKSKLEPLISGVVIQGNACFATQAIKDGDLWGEHRLRDTGSTPFETYTWNAKYGESLKWDEKKLAGK